MVCLICRSEAQLRLTQHTVRDIDRLSDAPIPKTCDGCFRDSCYLFTVTLTMILGTQTVVVRTQKLPAAAEDVCGRQDGPKMRTLPRRLCQCVPSSLTPLWNGNPFEKIGFITVKIFLFQRARMVPIPDLNAWRIAGSLLVMKCIFLMLCLFVKWTVCACGRRCFCGGESLWRGDGGSDRRKTKIR